MKFAKIYKSKLDLLHFINSTFNTTLIFPVNSSVLISKMGQDSTPPASPCHSTSSQMDDNMLRANNTELMLRVKELQNEVQRLTRQLRLSNTPVRHRGGANGYGANGYGKYLCKLA